MQTRHRIQPHRARGWRIALACIALLGANTASAAIGPGTSAHELLAQTLSALAPHRDLRALKSIQASTQTVSYDVVENDHLGAPYPFAGAAQASITDDLANARRLVVETTPGKPSRTVRTLFTRERQQAETSLDDQLTLAPTVDAPPSWETHDPIRVLLLAEQAADLQREPDTVRHEAVQHVLAFHHAGYPVRIFIDALTELPSATEATIALRRAHSAEIAWNGWGDVLERTEYLNWDVSDGVRYPQQWDMFRNDALFRTVTYADLHIDAPVAAEYFAMHTPADAPLPAYADDLQLGQPVANAPDPKRPIAEIAPAIVQIPNSWYTTLVRQDDGIVIIDAPISAGYSKRVLAEAARRFPGMPVKAVITSTGFYWHIAGIREYAAQGIPIYVRDRNEPIVRKLLASRHSIAPDDLARAPRTPIIHAVSTRTLIGSGTHAIVLLPIRYGEQPMLMTWIGDAHLLHTAEMVQPLGPHGSLLYPESLLELKHSVQEAGIATEPLHIIGMHMSPTPWSTLEETLGAGYANSVNRP
ncbi:hypothetical protein [Dyella silvatica]|uniref:hypothetical protein n=1 Tax=Dyella silvatica TaxID=2992128 RepID=UPI00224EEC37|nr:hypothetical protein [Dyella silvatica]